MTAIYKKELKGFLTSMIGFVFIAFLLAVSGIYYTAYHLQGGYPKFSYTLQAVLFIFLILVPVLTMRVLAEERRQKTDQLLLTAPVSVGGIVLGKYLALVSVFLIPAGILALYPLILSQFGSISYAEAYTALFGFFLLGSAYLSIGLFLSSVTESQVIAAVLTFFLLFVSYVMEGIASFFPETASGSFFTLAVAAAAAALCIHLTLKKTTITILSAILLEGILTVFYVIKPAVYEGLIQEILGAFSITAHFTEFAGGMFDVRGMVYYLTVIVLFLFLTVQSIQKRRWGADRVRLKNGSYSMTMTVIVTAACVIVNLIAAELPSRYTQIDITDQKLSVLTSQTEEIVSGLTEDITIYYIVQDGNYDANISRLLERYEDLSSHITVVEKDPVRYPNFVSRYTSEELPENSVILTCGDLSRIVSYNDMYESEFDYNYYSYTTTGFDAEGQITSALAAISSDTLPKVYLLSGHGELTLDSSLSSSVEKENIMTEELNLVSEEKVPEDADCLLILSPANDLSEAETAKIKAYLMTGGKAVIVTDYSDTELPNLDSIAEYYGIIREDGVVMEGNSQNYVQVPYYLVPTINSMEVTEGLSEGAGYVLLAAAQGLTQSEDVRESLILTEILSTSVSSYSKSDVENMTTYGKESGDLDGPFALGMMATEEVELTDEVLQSAEELLASANSSGLDMSQLPQLQTETEAGGKTADADLESEEEEKTTSAEEITHGDGEAADTEEITHGDGEAADTEETTGGDGEAADTEEITHGDGEAADTEETTGGDGEAADTEEITDEDEETPETATTKLVLYTSSSLLDSSADMMVSGGNSKLFVNTLSYMCGHETSVSIPVKSMSVEYLTLTAASSNFWSVIVTVIIPLGFILYGLFVWLKRRRQ